jgi:hypothetical protein
MFNINKYPHILFRFMGMDGELVPRNVIENVSCETNDIEVFSPIDNPQVVQILQIWLSRRSYKPSPISTIIPNLVAVRRQLKD